MWCGKHWTTLRKAGSGAALNSCCEGGGLTSGVTLHFSRRTAARAAQNAPTQYAVHSEKRLRTRPGRVRSFKCYRVGRVRSRAQCDARPAQRAVPRGGGPGENGHGRVPNASHTVAFEDTVEFEETDTSRARTGRVRRRSSQQNINAPPLLPSAGRAARPTNHIAYALASAEAIARDGGAAFSPLPEPWNLAGAAGPFRAPALPGIAGIPGGSGGAGQAPRLPGGRAGAELRRTAHLQPTQVAQAAIRWRGKDKRRRPGPPRPHPPTTTSPHGADCHTSAPRWLPPV
eukprot:gene25759-biopygen1484